MKIVRNLPKIFLMTIGFIVIKNILQISFGVISNAPSKPFDVLNIINIAKYTREGLMIYIIYFFLYEIVIFGTTFYFLMYLLLFILIQKFGNRISIHILFLLLIYNFVIQIFNDDKVEFYSILIVILLGFSNWMMFRKCMKFALNTPCQPRIGNSADDSQV